MLMIYMIVCRQEFIKILIIKVIYWILQFRT
nr:MAG TPA: hypothetical protein [Bacteriophage sp.]DAF14492.1 MAG TPA: hypothetical protein [Crassvirales sp.]